MFGKLRSMLGKYIRLQRLMRNLKQEHVAEKDGIDQSSYSRIEREQRDPIWSRVKKIAAGIGCRIRDFDPDEGEEEGKEGAGQRPYTDDALGKKPSACVKGQPSMCGGLTSLQFEITLFQELRNADRARSIFQGNLRKFVGDS